MTIYVQNFRSIGQVFIELLHVQWYIKKHWNSFVTHCITKLAPLLSSIPTHWTRTMNPHLWRFICLNSTSTACHFFLMMLRKVGPWNYAGTWVRCSEMWYWYHWVVAGKQVYMQLYSYLLKRGFVEPCSTLPNPCAHCTGCPSITGFIGPLWACFFRYQTGCNWPLSKSRANSIRTTHDDEVGMGNKDLRCRSLEYWTTRGGNPSWFRANADWWWWHGSVGQGLWLQDNTYWYWLVVHCSIFWIVTRFWLVKTSYWPVITLTSHNWLANWKNPHQTS